MEYVMLWSLFSLITPLLFSLLYTGLCALMALLMTATLVILTSLT